MSLSFMNRDVKKKKEVFCQIGIFKADLDNYLFFDERKQIFTNIVKIWTEVRIFLPAPLHQVIPGNEQFNVILVFTPVDHPSHIN